MLVARAATTVVVVPLLIAVLWIGGPLLWLAATAAAFQAAREATAFARLRETSIESWLARLGAPFMVLAAAFGPSSLVAAAAVLLLFALSTTIESSSARPRIASWERSFSLALYAGLPIALLILLRQTDGPALTLQVPGAAGNILVARGVVWALVVFTTTWAVDITAYAVGRLVGRHRFAPRISPHKTWEGTVGGVIAGAAVFAAWSPPLGWPLGIATLVGLVAAIAAVVGDLVESAMKRHAGMKDAGGLLPGHGGLLDRIDSLAFSTVVVFLWKMLGELLPASRLGL